MSGQSTASGASTPASRKQRLAVARAEALFTTSLPTGVTPTAADVQSGIRSTVIRHGGIRGCAAEVAGEFGDYPQTAARRMRWAISVVSLTYGSSPRHFSAMN